MITPPFPDRVNAWRKPGTEIRKINDKYNFRGDSTLVIYYKSADATVFLATGKAEINFWRERPILSRLYSLHVSFMDNNW